MVRAVGDLRGMPHGGLALGLSVQLCPVGFPYNFARFPLGIASIYAFGLGLMEIGFRRPSFQSLLYVWDFRLGFDYIYAGPESAGWQIAGLTKVLLAIGILVISFIASRRRKVLGAS
jgi:hypothetical protein